jgi:c-di-GMP-binding flagellar brake protein YcgR
VRLPEPGQQVFVVAPSGAAINAHVRDVSNKCTTLSFPEKATDPVSELAGGHVAIQYTNNRGVCRVDGVAHQAKGEGFLRVDHTGEVQLIQRREFVRVDATVRVIYRPMDPTFSTVETSSMNVSGGGFMISGSDGLHMHDVLPFTLELDGDPRESGVLEVIGRVVRATRGGLGIELQQIDERERERLIRWVFARERLGRQIVRET